MEGIGEDKGEPKRILEVPPAPSEPVCGCQLTFRLPTSGNYCSASYASLTLPCTKPREHPGDCEVNLARVLTDLVHLCRGMWYRFCSQCGKETLHFADYWHDAPDDEEEKWWLPCAECGTAAAVFDQPPTLAPFMAFVRAPAPPTREARAYEPKESEEG